MRAVAGVSRGAVALTTFVGVVEQGQGVVIASGSPLAVNLRVEALVAHSFQGLSRARVAQAPEPRCRARTGAAQESQRDKV